MTAQRRLRERPLVEDHPLALRISLGLLALGLFLYMSLAIDPLADGVQLVDDWVHGLAVAWEYGFLVGVANVLDIIGSTWVTAPVIVVVGVFLTIRRRWEALAFWALAMIVSQLLIGPVKDLYERARPTLPLVETTGFSFPSGHATASAAIAVALVIVLVRAGPKRRNLGMLAAAFAFLMASSRVYLRAHWLSDVVAGAALGIAVAIGAALLIHWIDERIDARAARP